MRDSGSPAARRAATPSAAAGAPSGASGAPMRSTALAAPAVASSSAASRAGFVEPTLRSLGQDLQRLGARRFGGRLSSETSLDCVGDRTDGLTRRPAREAAPAPSSRTGSNGLLSKKYGRDAIGDLAAPVGPFAAEERVEVEHLRVAANFGSENKRNAVRFSNRNCRKSARVRRSLEAVAAPCAR